MTTKLPRTTNMLCFCAAPKA